MSVTGSSFSMALRSSMTTIGAGAATYIVGPVTGTALGAGSEIVALSVAAGLVKSMLVMTGTAGSEKEKRPVAVPRALQ